MAFAANQIRVKCKAKALIVICLLLSVERSSQAVRTKPTPCSGTFSYEESDADDDRWFGDITLRVDKNVEGATLRITLDKPAQLLVSWAGAVFSPDNMVYIASHDEAILYAGTSYKLRIMVKFDKSKSVPSLKTIHFNSRLICPSQNVVDEPVYSTPGTRPDLNISDPSDVFSDIDKKTTTSRTSRPRPGNGGSTSKPNTGHTQTNRYPPPSSSGTPNPIHFSGSSNNHLNGIHGSGSNHGVGSSGGSYNNGEDNSSGFDKVTGATSSYGQGHSANANSNNNYGPNHGNGGGSDSGAGSGHVPCGTVSMANTLITHGQKTHQGQWPWHTALYKTEGINLSYLCGGSLVSKNKVITAAHCLVSTPGNKILSYKSLVIYLGKYNLRQYTGETGVQVKEVSRLNVNPMYNSSNYHGDIAILTLSSDVEFTNYVRPVCLWEATNSISDIERKEGVVAGWGLTELEQTSEELKIATLPVVSTETCLRSYPKFYSEYLGDTAFCAGFRNGTGPCNGDSGGGLVFKRNKDTWYLRGIVSLSVAKENLNFCDPNFYVIFTDTARYNDFIRKNIS